jgi:hypothetical protein
MTALGTHLPLLINDEDCNVGLPSSLEDRYIQPQGFARPATSQAPFTGFLAIIQVIRSYTHLYKVLKPSTITAEALQSLEEKVQATLSLFPGSYQPSSDAPLEPSALSPIIALQSARFLLYRRNLSPVYRSADRAEALRRCTYVAQDSAKYFSRTMYGSSSGTESESWRAKMAQVASKAMCVHLWHCVLMLCFRAEYEAALVCVQVMMAIGDVRKTNVACGKYLAFFLDCLMDRSRTGTDGLHQLEHDEELIAYVSGDMQANASQSWAWAGIDNRGPLSPLSPPHGTKQTHRADEQVQGTNLPLRPSPGSPENGVNQWDGWDRIEQMIRQLVEGHRARLAQSNPYYPPPHNPVKRVQLAPDAPASPLRSIPLPQPTSSSTSRISIANII